MSALPLAPADLDRLAKLLGMLGSDHDGERAAAAGKADSLLREKGVTWAQLIEQLKPVQSDGAAPFSSSLVHRRDAFEALGSPVGWADHEFEFLTNMTWRRKCPTEAQAKWLADLLDRARAARAAA